MPTKQDWQAEAAELLALMPAELNEVDFDGVTVEEVGSDPTLWRLWIRRSEWIDLAAETLALAASADLHGVKRTVAKRKADLTRDEWMLLSRVCTRIESANRPLWQRAEHLARVALIGIPTTERFTNDAIALARKRLPNTLRELQSSKDGVQMWCWGDERDDVNAADMSNATLLERASRRIDEFEAGRIPRW